MKNGEYYPTYLGGTGDYTLLFNNHPYQTHVPYLKEYYVLSTSYHFGQLCKHLIGKKQNDFVEMLLHHTVTIYLLVFSYLINIWECGAIISYIHDASDIMGHITKAMGQTTIKDSIIGPSFVGMMVCWFYMRCLMLPYCTYNLWVQGLVYGVFDREVFPSIGVSIPIYCYYLSLLAMLHFYWFSMFCRMIAKFFKDGDTED